MAPLTMGWDLPVNRLKNALQQDIMEAFFSIEILSFQITLGCIKLTKDYLAQDINRDVWVFMSECFSEYVCVSV